jgi:5-methylthioadenosine/S-adenosylhomocysteine deaminase
MLRVRAAMVHPVTAPSIENGAVLIDEAGRIAATGPHPHVPTPPSCTVLEFPDGMLVPGLINCHTHLELTHLAGRSSATEFSAWIKEIRELKDAATADEFTAAAERGLRQCWAAGVTTVADTGSTGAALRALARLGGRGIAYQEVFGPDPARLDRSMDELRTALDALAPFATATQRLGVSPHAPYTVSEPLYRAVAALARERRLPVALHLAESEAETRFVHDGTGPFADMHHRRGIAVTPHHGSPVELVRDTGHLTPDTLCIHCVQVDDLDIALLAASGAAVAHCPRSNTAHGHGRAPLAALRAAGVRVGLGTDSVVSVGDASLWAEADAAGLSGDDAVRALTLDGARALNWDGEIGSLEVGKAADLAVFAASARSRPLPPAPALLTVVAGRIVHGVDS